MSEMNRWAAPNLTDMASIARSGADWILGVAERTVGLMRWVVILSVALGATAFALGVAAADERYRIGVAIVEMLLFFVPAIVAWFVYRSLAVIHTKGPQLVRDLNTAARDPQVRQRLVDSVLAAEGDEKRSTWGRARRRSGEMWGLRKLMWGTKSDVMDLWASVVALTRVPFSLIVIGIGWAILGFWCLICLVVVLLG